MTGWGSPYLLTAGPGYPSYQGVAPPSCGLMPTLMTGQDGFNGALPRGRRRVGGGAFPDDGARSMGVGLSTG